MPRTTSSLLFHIHQRGEPMTLGKMTALIAACGACLLPPQAHAWLFTLDGPSSVSFAEQATSVAVTSGGDVVAAGMTVTSGSDTDLTVVKLGGVGGSVIWTAVIDGNAGSTDEPGQVLIDGSGDVIVGGTLQTTGDPRTLAVIKLSGMDGSELWRHLVSIPLNPFVPIGALALDAAGDVVTVGTAVNAGNGSADFAVYKLSGADGSELWRYTLDGSAGQDDAAEAVAVDASGDVFALGGTRNLGTGDVTVVKLSGTTGVELWQRTINGPAGGGDHLRALAVDAAQDVIAAGSMVQAISQDDLAVVKLSGTTGAELWRRLVGGSSRDFDSATAVAIDGAGDVVAAGFTTNRRTDEDITVLKLRGRTGRVRWRRRIDGGFRRPDAANALAVDAAGNVIVGGVTRTLSSGARFTVVSLTPSGRRRWRRDVAGSAGGFDDAFALTTDGAGNVVAGGTTENLGTGDDFTVVKFLAASGADAP
jgi:hypothetical protein